VIELVIWIDLNAQSVCTYQIWIFLILWCSTCWEDSKDYKLVISRLTELKIWFKQVNRSVYLKLKWFRNEPIKYEVLLYYWILDVLRIPRCIICYFWTQESKDMNFARLGSNLIHNSILNFVLTRSWHVSVCYWPIPICLDHHRGALDLIRSGCTRSSRTGSISDLIWGVRWRSDGRKESEESSPCWIRVTVAGERFWRAAAWLRASA
jgi:hypothetical protein